MFKGLTVKFCDVLGYQSIVRVDQPLNSQSSCCLPIVRVVLQIRRCQVIRRRIAKKRVSLLAGYDFAVQTLWRLSIFASHTSCAHASNNTLSLLLGSTHA